MREIPKIGKGKNMSIAKAALIYYYEKLIPEYTLDGSPFISSGDLDTAHSIVSIAGAEQASMFTHHQVLGRLHGSPYWSNEIIRDGKHYTYVTKGWLERRANCYRPTGKGKAYYEAHLKNRNPKQKASK